MLTLSQECLQRVEWLTAFDRREHSGRLQVFVRCNVELLVEGEDGEDGWMV